MRGRGLGDRLVVLLEEQPDTHFADLNAWQAHLSRLDITSRTPGPGTQLQAVQDPVRLATEGALWGSVKAHGFLPATVIVGDGAGQFDVGRHALCWVHDERLVHKLDTFTELHRKTQDHVRGLIWWYYNDLKAYRTDPTSRRRTELRARFDPALCISCHHRFRLVLLGRFRQQDRGTGSSAGRHGTTFLTLCGGAFAEPGQGDADVGRRVENVFLRLRWPDTDGKPVCPDCGCPTCYTCRRVGGQPRWRCMACRRDFSLTSGTLFAWHKLPLRSYLLAVAVFCNEVKGKSMLAFAARYAQEAAWREDLRRVSNGEQTHGVVGLAMACPPSVDFCGYWQRAQAA